jgi:hypothetical protein
MINVPPAFAELRQREPVFEVSPQAGLGRAVATKDVVHIADYAEEPIYKEQRHPAAVVLGKLGGHFQPKSERREESSPLRSVDAL